MIDNKHWLLGVDGGGTSCRVRLCDALGNTLGEGTAGSGNVRLGARTVFESILKATDDALTQANLSSDILSNTYAGLGLAGAVSSELNRSITDFPHPFAQLHLDNDAVTACLGAHKGSNGAILILGTGSCGMLNLHGDFHVLGGWGLDISDHASGARLGLSLVRRSLEAFEGLASSSPLTHVFMQRFEQSPPKLLSWSDTAKPKDYGSLVPVIIEFFNKGDAVATELINESLREAILLLDRLIAMGAQRICLMGGYSQFIKPLLPTRFSQMIIDPQGDALDGAIIMAKSMHRTNQAS